MLRGQFQCNKSTNAHAKTDLTNLYKTIIAQIHRLKSSDCFGTILHVNKWMGLILDSCWPVSNRYMWQFQVPKLGFVQSVRSGEALSQQCAALQTLVSCRTQWRVPVTAIPVGGYMICVTCAYLGRVESPLGSGCLEIDQRMTESALGQTQPCDPGRRPSSVPG